MGFAFNISAVMAPPERYVSLYRDFNTDYISDFGQKLTRHMTYHLYWTLRVSLVILLARMVCLHILLYGSLTQLKFWLIPYLVCNFMCAFLTVAALLTFPLIFTVQVLDSDEYLDFQHYWLYLLVFFVVLQISYEVAVASHFRQLHKRSVTGRQRLRNRSEEEEQQETEADEEEDSEVAEAISDKYSEASSVT